MSVSFHLQDQLNHRNAVVNFCAGPAAMPTQVLQQAAAELLDYEGRGVSIMEMSHRSDTFMAIVGQAEADLRELLGIADHYQVLFLQGGARLQFSMVPQNLLGAAGVGMAGAQTAAYVDTGHWSQGAIQEAQRFAPVTVVASARESHYTKIPDQATWVVPNNCAYLHYTPNETLQGLEFNWIPEVGAIPLVADMSSTILSRPMDVSKFGVIYAGAQKNIGPAGLTLVIVREDLLARAPAQLPSMLTYKTHADQGSMYNTPPTFAIYLASLVFAWLKKQGGLEAMAKVNQLKAKTLYSAIDASDFYTNRVFEGDRSWMNVPFLLPDDRLNALFLQQAEAVGLLNLKGHRVVGGMRASIYNAITLEGVQRLVDFMKTFEREHG